jgi:hypothetical protein
MPEFKFICADGHVFRSEGKYSEFDMARPCLARECEAQAFMLVDQMPALNVATMHREHLDYMKHNITFTGGDKEVQHVPNEHALQCQCDGCIGHRKRAKVTGTAEPLRRNRRVAKEVRA